MSNYPPPPGRGQRPSFADIYDDGDVNVDAKTGNNGYPHRGLQRSGMSYADMNLCAIHNLFGWNTLEEQKS